MGSHRRRRELNKTQGKVRSRPPLPCFEKVASRHTSFPNLSQDKPPPKTTLAGKGALLKSFSL